MKNNLVRTLIATCVGATVLTPVAFGQSARDLAEQGNNCQALAALGNEEGDRLRTEWVQESRTVVQAGDEERCLTYYDQATEALGPDAQDQEAAARIVVTQPDPDVNVQQRAPLVSVTQQEPQVRVNQGQPQIIVRQAQPNVRVEVPAPTITIDQPQPEIIVRMPDPDIAVTNPEPQVEVRQQDPQIDVSQPEPQVSVQADQAQSSEGADVELQQGEPNVEIQGSGNAAQVDVQRQQPDVQYEQAEPNIEVEQQGEPQIQFNQTGEPTIRFEDSGEETGQPVDQSFDAIEGTQSEMATSRASEMLREDQQMEAGDPMPYRVSDLAGRELHNARGEELGTVDRIVVSGNREYLVLTEGGFLGIGDREVAIPLDSVSVIRGGLVMRGMTEEDIEAMPEFDSTNAEPVADGQRVEIGTP